VWRNEDHQEKQGKKRPWHWDSIHQTAFDNVKTTVAKEVVLAYPDFSKPFEIYIDASTKQLGAVITQDNRPIAFFSRKLSDTQSKYTVTELELLAIVETIKEFNGMLWGQRKKSHKSRSRFDFRQSNPLEDTFRRISLQDHVH
jgi:hypothetical protein